MINELRNARSIPEDTKESVEKSIQELLRYFRAEGRALFVEMYDERDGADRAARNSDTFRAMEALTGREPRIIEYSRLDKIKPSEYALITFSGKTTKFVAYRDFGDRFGPLMEMIRETRVPVLAQSAGHPLSGAAYDGQIKRLDCREPWELDDHDMGVYGWRNLKSNSSAIITPNHPLFAEYLKTDGRVWHSQAESVRGLNDDDIAILVDSTAKNGERMSHTFELKNPSKHFIALQPDLGINPSRGMRSREQPHYSGIVLLVSALELLTTHSAQYTQTKEQLYAPK